MSVATADVFATKHRHMARQLVDKILNWLGGHELIILFALLVVAGGTWSFIELADSVSEGTTQRVDERVLLALRQPGDADTPIGPEWLKGVMRDITALGGFTVLIFVTLTVIAFLWIERQYATLVFVCASIPGGFALAMWLKALSSRPRPDVVTHLAEAALSSFPSGHSMMSAIVYITLGSLLSRLVERREVKFFVLAVPLFLTTIIGVSRVYVGVHYPTDVLAGWSAGLAWSMLCWLVARALGLESRMADSGS